VPPLDPLLFVAFRLRVCPPKDAVGMPFGFLLAFGPSSFGFGSGLGGVAGAVCIWGGVAISMVTSSLLQLQARSLGIVAIAPCLPFSFFYNNNNDNNNFYNFYNYNNFFFRFLFLCFL
jgi:hypothetical protein